MTPSQIGAIAEAKVAHALLSSGMDVYVPLFNAHGRADLVIDGPLGLQRVQCKTARRRGEVIIFRTCSNTASVAHDYRGEVDLFGVWSPDLEKAYLIPVDDVATRACYLRLSASANGQVRGIRWAADYAIELSPSRPRIR